MADPVTTGVILAGTLAVAKRVENFIAAASGHHGEDIGTILGNIVDGRRKNAETVIAKSDLILLDLGVEPGEVPLNILQPILEGASVQEDPYLQDTWANLLANAADCRNRHPFQVCFAGMLRNLSSREVKFLDGVWGDQRPPKVNENQFHKIYRDAGLVRTPEPAQRPHYSTQMILSDADDAEFDLMIDILEREKILAENAGTKSGNNRFTRLGLAFVRACQKPTA